MKSICAFVVMAFALGRAALPITQAEKQPVYVYLYARVTDHINLEVTEDRLRRLLPMLERYRKEHPDSHISAIVLFSGAASKALAQRNSQTHIVDFVKEYMSRGIIEAGYDGTDEPTYENRPTIDFTQTGTPQDRWLLRRAVEEKFLSDGRDPLTGAEKPNEPGGLNEMQRVFGKAACITGLQPLIKFGPGGLYQPVTTTKIPGQSFPAAPSPPGLIPEVGGDTEAVLAARRYNSTAIMFGMFDTNPAHIPGFTESRAGFSGLMSPAPETAPELYWQDYVLRSSEASSDTVRLVHAFGGIDSMKKVVEKADRSKIHVIHVELAAEQNYLTSEFIKGPEYPPLAYGYHHRDSPGLPASALRDKTGVEAAFAQEDAVLRWLCTDFFPANPASEFISSTGLTRIVEPATGFSVSLDGLRSALSEYLKHWGNNTFAPPLFRVDGHYLSMAERFQVLMDALAEFHRTGTLPASVKVVPVYGPIRVLTGHGPNIGEISVDSVASMCADMAHALHDQTPGPIPKNSIPIGIRVEGALLNPAQFLKLMGQAVMNPAPEAKLNIRMSYEFTETGQSIPRSRPDMDDGFVWTLKPAQIERAAR